MLLYAARSAVAGETADAGSEDDMTTRVIAGEAALGAVIGTTGEVGADRVAGAQTTAARDAVAAALAAVPVVEQVIFAGDKEGRTELAYQVPFPRVGLVLSGRLEHVVGSGDGTTRVVQTPQVALFVPADGWNDPQWCAGEEVETLDLLFGKQRLGFALARWNGSRQVSLAKYDVPRRGPRIGTFILQALGELLWRPQDTVTSAFLVRALISHAEDLMSLPSPAATRSAAFLQVIRDHVDEHYQAKLTRESVADSFGITPNYLSHLFQKEIHISFNEYVNMVRLERAKHLLHGYDLSIKEIAKRCGFTDSNYFCRLFRQKTDRSPSEYRVHYRSRSQA